MQAVGLDKTYICVLYTFLSLYASDTAGALRDGLQKEIIRLATSHKAPIFVPHVTLVGEIWLTSQPDVIARATAAAKSLKARFLKAIS